MDSSRIKDVMVAAITQVSSTHKRPPDKTFFEQIGLSRKSRFHEFSLWTMFKGFMMWCLAGHLTLD